MRIFVKCFSVLVIILSLNFRNPVLQNVLLRGASTLLTCIRYSLLVVVVSFVQFKVTTTNMTGRVKIVTITFNRCLLVGCSRSIVKPKVYIDSYFLLNLSVQCSFCSKLKFQTLGADFRILCSFLHTTYRPAKFLCEFSTGSHRPGVTLESGVGRVHSEMWEE